MTYEIWTETELNLKNDLRHNEYVITGIKVFDYEGPVYDLKVENVHNYTVSDVTVHNSVGGSEIAYLLNISNTDPIRLICFLNVLSLMAVEQSLKLNMRTERKSKSLYLKRKK